VGQMMLDWSERFVRIATRRCIMEQTGTRKTGLSSSIWLRWKVRHRNTSDEFER
jgi:hypothetical protein